MWYMQYMLLGKKADYPENNPNSSEYQTKTIEFLTLELLCGIFFMSVLVCAKLAIFISKMYPKYD